MKASTALADDQFQLIQFQVKTKRIYTIQHYIQESKVWVRLNENGGGERHQVRYSLWKSIQNYQLSLFFTEASPPVILIILNGALQSELTYVFALSII